MMDAKCIYKKNSLNFNNYVKKKKKKLKIKISL